MGGNSDADYGANTTTHGDSNPYLYADSGANPHSDTFANSDTHANHITYAFAHPYGNAGP